MATKRKPTAPATEAMDQFCAPFDELIARVEERTALRHSLIGLRYAARAQQGARGAGGHRAGSQLQAPDPYAEPAWTLDTLTAAREHGIQVARSQSQVRRSFRQEGVRWRRTRLWATSRDPDFAPKGRGSLPSSVHELARIRTALKTLRLPEPKLPPLTHIVSRRSPMR